MTRVTNFFRTHGEWLVYGVLLGALIMLAIRFFTYHVPSTHYHANFAVYINGQHEEFKNPAYYEDVSACSMSGKIQPLQRAHMHDKVNSVVHVHDDGVTWGQFFENLGWYIGPDFVQTRDGTMYKASGDSKLHILLNGDDLTGLAPITDQIIGDQARLLVSFGDVSDQQLQQEYSAIQNTAKHYDESNDPASCAGQMQKVTPSDRLHHLF